MSPVNAPFPSVAREGPLLVMHRAATLPNRCVTTGGPAEGPPDECTLAHADTGVAMAGAAGGALGAVLAMLIARWMGNKYTIAIPQSDSARSKRWWMGTVGLLMLVSGIGAVVGFIVLNPAGSEIRTFGALGSLLVAIIGIAIWIDNLEPLRISKVQGDHIWLAGASEEYLKTLPEWPNKITFV